MTGRKWPEERKVKELDRHRCRTVSISDRHYNAVRELGEGSFSKGVNMMVRSYIIDSELPGSPFYKGHGDQE